MRYSSSDRYLSNKSFTPSSPYPASLSVLHVTSDKIYEQNERSQVSLGPFVPSKQTAADFTDEYVSIETGQLSVRAAARWERKSTGLTVARVRRPDVWGSC